MPTIRNAWRIGHAQLHLSPSPALDARLLLEHVLGRDHAYLIAHDDEQLPGGALDAYRQLLTRAAAGEPIPYLIGHAPFMGLEFVVSPDVLIPRPETEQLVATAAGWSIGRAVRAVDVGTGSGCIAISLTHLLPQAEVVAVDCSEAALRIAIGNAARHTPGRVSFVQADLLSALAAGFDLLVANLPYVAEGDWPALPVGVKFFEPRTALDGGADGLDLIRSLLPQAAARLKPRGLVALEIGYRQGEATAALARAAFPGASVEIRPDFAGLDRLVVIQT
jgi:release factor glutamine methyltransferase